MQTQIKKNWIDSFVYYIRNPWKGKNKIKTKFLYAANPNFKNSKPSIKIDKNNIK